MLLNASPLNAAPLNGAVRATAPDSTLVVQPVVSVLWDLRLMLGGLDVTAQLTGQVRIEREEGAAALADFVLLLGDGPVNPAAFIGQTVQIFYREWRAGSWLELLRFTGQVLRPQYSLQGRTLSCNCSDRLQDDIEKLTVAQIDVLCGGLWSADTFELPDGRSRWDYAHERLSTRPVSLQKSVDGALWVTSWAATTPAFLFPVGSVLDESLDYTPVELSERINVVELELDYRFVRLRERHHSFGWTHPDISGLEGIQGFCLWRKKTTELPDIAMITQASEGAGYQFIIAPSWNRLPPSGAYCDPPAGWINIYTDLLLAASWTGAMRWSQPVTEQYKLRIESPASITQAGEVIRRDRITAETESDKEQAFLDKKAPDGIFLEVGGGSEPGAAADALGDLVTDLREDARLDLAVAVGVSIARVQIAEAHRGNRISFQLPTSDTLGVGLQHSLQVEDEVVGRTIRAGGKLFSLIDEWDFASGSAISTLSMAISQGGGAQDDPVLTPPKPISTPAGGAGGGNLSLATQLGGLHASPIYDAEETGFAGNYDREMGVTAEPFPRRFDLIAPEIPASHRDEFVAVRPATYRVAIPDDLLEL